MFHYKRTLNMPIQCQHISTPTGRHELFDSPYPKLKWRMDLEEPRNWKFVVHHPVMIDPDKIKEVLTAERPLLVLKGKTTSKVYFHRSLLLKAKFLGRSIPIFKEPTGLKSNNYNNEEVPEIIAWAKDIRQHKWPENFPAQTIIAYQPKV